MNKLVAQDAKLSKTVMLAHYITEENEALRQASNRTYIRIRMSLSVEVAECYGYRPDNEVADLERRGSQQSGHRRFTPKGQNNQPTTKTLLN